jgi:hypothetical protein
MSESEQGFDEGASEWDDDGAGEAGGGTSEILGDDGLTSDGEDWGVAGGSSQAGGQSSSEYGGDDFSDLESDAGAGEWGTGSGAAGAADDVNGGGDDDDDEMEMELTAFMESRP